MAIISADVNKLKQGIILGWILFGQKMLFIGKWPKTSSLPGYMTLLLKMFNFAAAT